MITEQHLRKAIKHARIGKINGLVYDQNRWCGTSCCVLGFARHIAGKNQLNAGPNRNTFEKTPWVNTITRLMNCTSSDILTVMEAVDENGIIQLNNADLEGTNLKKADLRYADLEGANLHRANLHGANLYCANLHRADLHRADLKEANLYGANLEGANLEGANLNNIIK